MEVLVYEFYVQMEKGNQCFTLADICAATGYKQGTDESHMSKKWRWFLQSTPDGLRCQGILPCPKEEFLAGHRQVWEWKPPSSAPHVGQIDRSQNPHTNALLLLIFVLVAMGAFHKYRQKWRLKIWRLSLPL